MLVPDLSRGYMVAVQNVPGCSLEVRATYYHHSYFVKRQNGQMSALAYYTLSRIRLFPTHYSYCCEYCLTPGCPYRAVDCPKPAPD